MSDPDMFSDEELTAFLDGEADDALQAAIEAQLETDAGLAERMAGLDIPIAPIAAAFDAFLDTAPPMPALPDAPTAPVAPAAASRFGWGWGIGTFGTGLAAGLAVAAFVGFNAAPPEPQPRGWVSFVASYQALYTAETLQIAAPTPQDVTLQLASASDALGVDLSTLPMADGLTFKRAQVLGFRGKPLVQIAYQRADGTPVALCIIPSGPDDKPMSMGAAEGLELARWNTPGLGFLLIGGADADPLAQEADTFQTWSRETAI